MRWPVAAQTSMAGRDLPTMERSRASYHVQYVGAFNIVEPTNGNDIIV